MHASVYKLRTMGTLDGAAPPSDPSKWERGILEFSTAAGDGTNVVPRRLILRSAQANPTLGVLMQLYKPELIDARHPHLHLRGIEPTPMSSGVFSAMVQEWLVVIG